MWVKHIGENRTSGGVGCRGTELQRRICVLGVSVLVCVRVCVCQPVWGWMKVDPGASGMSGEGEGVGVGVVSPPCVAFWVGL